MSFILGVFNCLGKCYIPAGTFFHFYLLFITHFLIHSSFFDHVNFQLSVPIILVVANDGLAIGLPKSCFVGGKFNCFMFCFMFDFHFTHKIVLAFSKTDCYVFLCEFSNANRWVDEVEFKVKAGTGLGVHDALCLLDGKSALEIQMEHPPYQIFNLTNFWNNVSCL